MKTYNSLDDFKVNFKTVVTIGTFDGVHLGHRYIINQLNKIAEREGAESVLLTFSPHPRIEKEKVRKNWIKSFNYSKIYQRFF